MRIYVWADIGDSDREPGVSSAQPFGVRKARKSCAQRRIEKRVSEQAKQLPVQHLPVPEAEHGEQQQTLEQQTLEQPEQQLTLEQQQTLEQHEQLVEQSEHFEQHEKRGLIHKYVECLYEQQRISSEQLAMYKREIYSIVIGCEASVFCEMLTSPV